MIIVGRGEPTLYNTVNSQGPSVHNTLWTIEEICHGFVVNAHEFNAQIWWKLVRAICT
jgi:hypothetical protein